MRKIIYLIIFLLPISILAIDTKYNNEIDQTLKKSIDLKTKKLSESIQNENYEEFIKLISNDFKKKIQYFFPSFIKNTKPIFKINDIYKLNDYYSFSKTNEEKNAYIISAPDEKSLSVKKIHIKNKSYIQFFSTKMKGIQDLIFLQYIYEDNDWKLNILGGGTYSYDNKTPSELIKESKVFKNKKEFASSILYATAAGKLLRPTSYLFYKNEREYITYIINTANDLASIYPFPRSLEEGNNTSLFQIDINGTEDGLLPIIKYSTSTNISSHKEINNEAKKISKEIFKIYPDLLKNFEYILFQAYDEIPDKPNKDYRIYNTILQKGELLQKTKKED